MDAEIRFEGVSFRYADDEEPAPSASGEPIPSGDEPAPQAPSPVLFRGLDLELPPGVVSFIGQNGTGKSTLLLLASGRLLPTEGRVLIRGRDSRELTDESDRQSLVSFVYQNMEFETEQPIGELLRYVRDHGLKPEEDGIEELVEVFELGRVLRRRTQEVSKGELQRAILAFSLLYGSPILVMDEPIFALEEPQKKRVMEYLCERVRRDGLSLYYSLHELDLSREYSDYLLLFFRDGPPRLGVTSEMFNRKTIEEAYEVPFDFLKRREEIYRSYLTELLKVRRKG